MAESEQHILEQYVSDRDPEAFQKLVERHRDMVFAACHRVLGNAADAEDAAQEAFLRLVRKAGGLRAPIASWLHHVATQISINLLHRRQSRAKRDLKAGHMRSGAQEILWEDVKGDVDRSIAQLPEEWRAPLVMHYLEGRKLAEIGAELGITESAVSRRLKRAVEHLQMSMRKGGWALTVAALAAWLGTETAEAAPPALTASLGKMALAGLRASSSGKGAAVRVGARIATKKLVIAASITAVVTGGVTIAVIASSNKGLPARAAAAQSDPREDPVTAIAEAIRLLEAEEYRTFVEQFVPPEALNTVVAMMTLDEFAQDFADKSAGKVLEILRMLRGRTPSLNADGTVATFTLGESIAGRDSFALVKIGRYWYIPSN